MKLVLLSLLLWWLPAPPVWACYVPPEHLTVPYSELVRRTASIVLAEARKITDLGKGVYRYHFRSVDVVKGERTEDFTMDFSHLAGSPDSPNLNTDFNGHRDGAFWDRRITRQWNGPDCEMHPRFVPGSRYLIFRSPPFHWKSFERIVSEDDRWLAAVKIEVQSAGRRRGFSQDVYEWLRERFAVDVNEVESCPREPTPDWLPRIKRLEHIAGTPIKRSHFWPDFGRVHPPCQPGMAFLAVHYRDENSERLIHPSAFPLDGGIVDFSGVETEVELVGPLKIPLKDLKRRLP